MESNIQILNSSFNIMRRLSSNEAKENIKGLGTLILNENLRQEVLSKID